MSQRSIPCPRCRRPIAPGESSCPWCGAKRPGFFGAFSGRVGRSGRGDWLISGILAANIGYYLLSLLLTRHHQYGMNPLSFLSPDQPSLSLLGATGSVPVLGFGRFWTLIAASYLHGGLLHIFFNMVALRQIGPWVSAEFGTNRMFVIYTLSGVAGYLVSCLAGVPYTIGASASVCGLIGALYFFGKHRGGSYGGAVTREVSGWLISLALFGLVMPGINNWAHGGGVVGGALLAWILGYQARGPERAWHRLLALICLAATVLVLLWGAFVGLMVMYG